MQNYGQKPDNNGSKITLETTTFATYATNQ